MSALTYEEGTLLVQLADRPGSRLSTLVGDDKKNWIAAVRLTRLELITFRVEAASGGVFVDITAAGVDAARAFQATNEGTQ